MVKNFVIHDDALEAVGALGEFDYILTDPPYPTGGESSVSNPKSIKDCREMIDGMMQSYLMGVLRNIKLKETASIWLFCDWRQVSFFSSCLRGLGFNGQSCIVWDKTRGTLSARYHPSHEMILWAYRGKNSKNFKGRDLIQMPRVSRKDKNHTFDKPVKLAEILCKGFPPGKVIDPFCGCGSLLVGAQNLGYDVTGIDISKEYCDIANERLNANDY